MNNPKLKRTLCTLLAAGMMLSLASCGNNSGSSTQSSSAGGSSSSSAQSSGADSSKAAEDPFLTGEKPELKILTYYQAYDMNEDPANAIAEKVSGYKVKWYNLPQDNATEKLMLEIAGGSKYDMITRMSTDQAGQLNSQNALMDMTELLNKYGANIQNAVSSLSWSTTTSADGSLFGIPNEAFDGPQPGGDPFGVLKGGIAFRSDDMEELGLTLPTNIDEFYNVLKTYTDKNGKAALTAAKSGWQTAIMAAFGMGDPTWYEKDGKVVHRIRHEGMIPYLTFMQKIYKEGILDNDMPINAAANAQEKYSSNNALAMPMMFWDIPAMKDAIATSNPNCKSLFATFLAPDGNTKPTVYVKQGVSGITSIPKTAENPEHAVIWFNALSDPDNFRTIYIGEEGVSYELKNNQYYPIFTEDESDMDFSKYTNADKFTGAVQSGEVFKMWQARARKTPEMAEAYEQMNARVGDYNIVSYYETYAAGLPAIKENSLSLNTMINDELIKAIAEGTDPNTVMANIISQWEAGGGAECEKEMQTWYDENKAMLK